jgi:hypothetical protein
MVLLATLRAALATCMVAASAVGAHSLGGGTIAWTTASILMVTGVSLPLIAAAVASGPWQVAAYMVLAQAAAHTILTTGHPSSTSVVGTYHGGMSHGSMSHGSMSHGSMSHGSSPLGDLAMPVSHTAAALLTAVLLTAANKCARQVHSAQTSQGGLPTWVLWLVGSGCTVEPVEVTTPGPKPADDHFIPAVQRLTENHFARRGPPCVLPG